MSIRPFKIGAICMWDMVWVLWGRLLPQITLKFGYAHKSEMYRLILQDINIQLAVTENDCSRIVLERETLLNVNACISMWSGSHSGHPSVITAVIDLALGSELQRPYIGGLWSKKFCIKHSAPRTDINTLKKWCIQTWASGEYGQRVLERRVHPGHTVSQSTLCIQKPQFHSDLFL